MSKIKYTIKIIDREKQNRNKDTPGAGMKTNDTGEQSNRVAKGGGER